MSENEPQPLTRAAPTSPQTKSSHIQKATHRTKRVPEKLWIEVHDIVQEAVINTIPKKHKCQKAKWLSEEALQITEKRREAKGKGGKERYTHLNAEFQRIAMRDKKAFLSDQCKEIEGSESER